MKNLLILSICVALLYTVSAKPTTDDDYDPTFGGDDDKDMQKDDYGNYDSDPDENDDDDEADPFITSESQNFEVKPNDTILLPCEIVGNTDTYVIMWKKDQKIVFQDTIALGDFKTDKYMLNANKSIQIKDIDEKDEGEYSCEVVLQNTSNPKVIHHVTVKTEPRITAITADKNVNEYKIGDTLSLNCKAEGKPQPKIKWSFKGEPKGMGEKMIIENIGHDNNGDYQCLADNGVGKLAHASINIKVLHKPTVKLEKLTTNIQGETYDVELRCEVHSIPNSIIVWRKDGLEVVIGGHIKHRNKNHIDSLIIKQVTPTDMGKYSCSATNQVGTTEQHFMVSNRPSAAIYAHVEQDHNGKDIDFIWEVESLFPISEYLLEYKKKTDSEWKVEKPEVTNAEGTIYTIRHTLRHLHAGEYEIKVKSKNEYGWSTDSKVATFKTIHHKHHPKKQQTTYNEADENITAQKSEVPSSSSTIVPSTTLVCLFFLTIFNRH